MSWLDRPPVTPGQWLDLDTTDLIHLLPRPPWQMCKGDLHRPRWPDPVPPECDCAFTHYRFLTAAMLGHSTFSPDSKSLQYATSIRAILLSAGPDQPYDWLKHREQVTALQQQHLYMEDGSDALEGPPYKETLRNLLEWLRFGREDETDGREMPDHLELGDDRPYDRMRLLIHEIVGYPWRPSLRAEWLTSDVTAIARGIWADRAWDRTPILADAFQDAGCDHADTLAHLRDPTRERADGCWAVIDALLPAPND